PSWGELTYAQVAERARAEAASLDALGVAQGERVAIVSHNAARLFTSFWGVSGWGRILVPINFRLNAAEIDYIVGHCGASVLLVDPELDADLSEVTAPHRFVLGDEADHALFAPADAPQPWDPHGAAPPARARAAARRPPPSGGGRGPPSPGTPTRTPPPPSTTRAGPPPGPRAS